MKAGLNQAPQFPAAGNVSQEGVCGILELAHLGASSKCNTLFQRMNTGRARRRGDPRTDLQESPPPGNGKIPAAGGGVSNPSAQERRLDIEHDASLGAPSTAALAL